MLTEHTFAGRDVLVERGDDQAALETARHILSQWRTVAEVRLYERRGAPLFARVTRDGVYYPGAPAR